MAIWKLHALGNNFVFTLHDESIDYPALAQELCRTATSVGGDGILSVDPSSAIPVVRMWNPDGSPDFCGNGLCCAAHLLHRLRADPVTCLRTPYSDVPVTVSPIDQAASQVSIKIGRGQFDPALIPLAIDHGTVLAQGIEIVVDNESFHVIPVNNGNMHSLIFVEELPDDGMFLRLGPKIENHPLFPSRTNVLWCAQRGDELHLRIWERAVGETHSCGTGAAAAVAICEHAGIPLPSSVPIVMRGGTAEVTLTQDGVQLSTTASLVFEGRLIQPL